MKTLFLLLTLFSPLWGIAQLVLDLPTDAEGKLNYNDVVKVDGLSKQDLYHNSKQFLLMSFGSAAADAIIRDDETNGIVISKGCFEFDFLYLALIFNKKMWFTLEIESRDNRYRYQIYDIYFEDIRTNVIDYANASFDKSNYYRSNGKPKPINEIYLGHMASNILYLITTLESSMKPHNSKLDDSW